jgi:hypothetical protein
LDELGQVMVKQLKNRYNDVATNRKFVIGIDRSKMKLFDVDDATAGLINAAVEDDEDERPRAHGRRGAHAHAPARAGARAKPPIEDDGWT